MKLPAFIGLKEIKQLDAKLYDQHIGKLYRYISDLNNGAITFDNLILAPFFLGSVSITGAYTLTSSDALVFIDSTSAAYTVTLPTASGNKGRIFILTVTAGANLVTVNTAGGNINGGTSIGLPGQYQTAKLASDGTNYFLI